MITQSHTHTHIQHRQKARRNRIFWMSVHLLFGSYNFDTVVRNSKVYVYAFLLLHLHFMRSMWKTALNKRVVCNSVLGNEADDSVNKTHHTNYILCIYVSDANSKVNCVRPVTWTCAPKFHCLFLLQFPTWRRTTLFIMWFEAIQLTFPTQKKKNKEIFHKISQKIREMSFIT